MLILLQILTAVMLFFLINIIGKYAPTEFRYFQISGFLQTDEAPAFNFAFRVLTPVVFMIILSTCLYYFSLDSFVHNIYFINVFYVLFRAIFTIVIDRTALVNWRKQMVYAVSIVVVSYFIYAKFIVTKENLLPDFSNLANELWIIILLFLYKLLDSVPSSDDVAEKRKIKYIGQTLSMVKRKFERYIDAKTQNIRLRQLIYAIIIHENFNRPKAFRIMEYLRYFLTRKPATFGIMQVRSPRPLGDKESVKQGIEIVLQIYSTLKTDYDSTVDPTSDNWVLQPEQLSTELEAKLIRSFNHCDDYTNDITELADYIDEHFYHNIESSNRLFT